MPKVQMTISKTELKALWMAAHQPHLLRGKYKMALRRAGRIIDHALLDLRRSAIYTKGIKDAKNKLPADPTFEGERLGSNESFTYYRGYGMADPTFKNPYGCLPLVDCD